MGALLPFITSPFHQTKTVHKVHFIWTICWSAQVPSYDYRTAIDREVGERRGEGELLAKCKCLTFHVAHVPRNLHGTVISERRYVCLYVCLLFADYKDILLILLSDQSVNTSKPKVLTRQLSSLPYLYKIQFKPEMTHYLHFLHNFI